MRKFYTAAILLVLFSALFWRLPSYYDHSDAIQKSIAQTRDVLFKIRQASSQVPVEAKDILLVTIDNESCERLDMRWPWSRQTFAAMIDVLRERGAKVIGLNLSFTGLEDGNDASSQALSLAVRQHGHVVFGTTFDKDNHMLKPTPLIAEALAGYGYLEKIVDEDFFIRRSYLLRPYSLRKVFGEIYETQALESQSLYESSFPLKLALAAWDIPGSLNSYFDGQQGVLHIGKRTVGKNLDLDGSYVINYLIRASDLEEISAWRVVRGKIKTDDVKGKIVLIGLTSSLFSDVHATPLGMMPGIVIHANEFLSLVSGRSLTVIPNRFTFLISWLISLCLLALFVFRRLWLAILGFFISFFGLFLFSEILFARDRVLEPFIALSGPVCAVLTGVVANLLILFLENKGLETKVTHDKMTGLYTYDYLRLRLDDEWRRCQKLKFAVSIVMTDLDRFKKINDTLGHEVGNQMILRAAKVIHESVRGYDVVSRYGGDEFAILLWHSNLAEARAYRERLRGLYHLMAKKIEHPLLSESSISIGVASYDPALSVRHPANPQQLIEAADKDLFLDKQRRG